MNRVFLHFWRSAMTIWMIVVAVLCVWRGHVPWPLVVAGAVFSVSQFWIWRWYRRRRATLITIDGLVQAPMWTILRGSAEDPGPIKWDTFVLEPVEPYPEDVEREMWKLNVSLDHPEVEDEWLTNPWRWRWFRWQRPDDLDAALAYLNTGGTLCKVPDAMDSKYWRLLVVSGPVRT